MLRQTARAFTLPRTRAALGQTRRRGVLFWWPAAALALLTCALLRGYADDVGFPVHGAEVEEGWLGFLPTQWLQQSVYPIWPWAFQWAFVGVHVSWFAVPWTAALLVSWRRPERIGSFFRWWIALHAVVVAAFVMFPLEPPWMADARVVRIVPSAMGVEVNDPNPLAAMPSLHVALPLLISLWFLFERWRAPGFVMLAYAAIVAFEVVFSGEHYLVDVIAAGGAALTISLAARLDWRRLLSGIKEAVERKVAAGQAGRPQPIPVPVQHKETGQTLLEMAIVFPLIFVFIMFIVDFGIALDRREMVQHAVREGARRGAVGDNTSEIVKHTVDQSHGALVATDVNVCYLEGSGDGNLGNPGDTVRVSANYEYNFTVGSGEMLTAFGAAVPTITMSPSANARLETDIAGGAAAC